MSLRDAGYTTTEMFSCVATVAYTFSPAAKLIDLVQPARPLGAVRNEMGFLQNAQVLRNRGTADRKVVRQFADRDGTVQKPVENRPAVED